MAMKAKPANTSLPLITQTARATIAAGKMKKRTLTITMIIMMPSMRRTKSASQPIGPKEGKKSDTGNIDCSNCYYTLKLFSQKCFLLSLIFHVARFFSEHMYNLAFVVHSGR